MGVSMRGVVWFICFAGAFFTTGPIFGWPALQLMLRDEGIYADLCGDAAANSDCPERSLKLKTIFSAGFFTLLAGRLGWGLLLDRFGPRFTATSACLVVALGALLMALSGTDLDGFVPAAALIGLGGPGIHCSNFQVSNLFPEKKRMITTSFSGIFGTSGLVFAILRGLYNLGVSFRALLGGYAVICVIVAGALFNVQPTKTFKPGDKVSQLGCFWRPLQLASASGDKADAAKASGGGAQVESFWAKVCKQLVSAEGVGITFFFSVLFLHLQFYLGNATEMLAQLGDDGTYAMVFNVVGSSALVFTPCIGGFLDRVTFDVAFLVCTVLALVYNICSHVPSLEFQVVTFIFWTLARLLLFAGYFSFLPATFGFRTFGTVQGATSFVSALIGLLGYPLTVVAFDMEDGHAIVMGGFAGAVFLCLVFPVMLFVLRRAQQKKKASGDDKGAKTPETQKASGDDKTPTFVAALPATSADVVTI